MASFTAGTTFQTGVANDVTAPKLEALITAATPTSGFIQDRTTETVVAVNDTILIGDASDSNNLKKMTVANLLKAPLVSTSGTVDNLTTGTTTSTAQIVTSGTITTALIPTLTTGTTTSTNEVVTNGTITNLSATTSTFLGTITGSTNVINIGGGQIYKDGSGNVGVGTTAPSTFGVGSKLVVAGAITSGSINYSATFSDGTTNQLRIGHVSGVANILTDANAVAIRTAGTSEQIRIGGDKVGIGITSPASKLHIDSGSSTLPLIQVSANSGSPSYFGGANSLFTGGGTTDLGIFSSNKIMLGGSGSPTATITGGNFGIGITSPSAQLELSTDSAKKPSTNTWTITSDQRLKTNITNADNNRCYEIVKQVPLKRYTWKGEVYSQEQVKDRSKLGWIAQDVEEVFPKAVGTSRFAYNQIFEDVITPELDSDGNAVLDENGVAKTKTEKRLVSEDVIEDCKDLNSDQIYAAMYGTIQKLIEKVESLESKVAALEAA